MQVVSEYFEKIDEVKHFNYNNIKLDDVKVEELKSKIQKDMDNDRQEATPITQEMLDKAIHEAKEEALKKAKEEATESNIKKIIEYCHKIYDEFERHYTTIDCGGLLKILKCLNDNSPNDLNECISYIITVFNFSSSNASERDRNSKLILKICTYTDINAEPRLKLADTLFHNDDTRVLSFHSYLKIVDEKSLNLVLLMRALSYLFCSNATPHMQKVASALDKVVCDPTRHSFHVFKQLSDMLYKFDDKIRKPYLIDTIWTFLCQKHHEIEQKILASIYLLENHKMINDIQKKGVYIFLSNTMENKQKNVTYNKQADAADALMRYGDEKYSKKAKDVIEKLGGNKRNVYENLQSSHAVDESVVKFLKQLKEKHILLQKYGRFYEDITQVYKDLMIKGSPKDCEKFTKLKSYVYGSLDRIGSDVSSFCGMDMREIIQRVYNKIYDEPDIQYRVTLIHRFFEELAESYGTCTSGHVNRLANVFLGGISISFEAQIMSNYEARFNAKIKNITDDELKGNIIVGTMLLDKELDELDDDDKESFNAYHKFIEKNKDSVEAELYKEFVGGNYVDEQVFKQTTEKYYKQIKYIK